MARTARHAQQGSTVTKLATAQTLSGLGITGTFAAGSLLVVQISGSEALAGLVQTSTVVGAALLALPLARWTDRGGRRRSLGFGYFLGALGATLAFVGGVQEIFPLIFVGAAMIGGASAAGYQARFAAVDLSDDNHRARDLSMVVWASTVGSVLGPNLMEPAGDFAVSIGLPKLVGPYLVAIVMLTLAATIILMFLKPDPFLLAREERGEGYQHKRRVLRQAFYTIKTIPQAWLALHAIVTGHVAMVTIMVMTPVHMAHVDVSLRLIGLVISVHVLGMYALSPLVGKIVDRFGRSNTIILGVALLLASAVISGLAYADAVVQLGIGLFLLGLGWSCTLIAGSTLLAESLPAEIDASGQGLSDLCMNGGGAIGGALAGFVIALSSYGWLCAVMALPVLYLGLRAWQLRRK
jgi:MFS family permease